MGKPSGRKKKHVDGKTGDSSPRHSKTGVPSPKAFDSDTNLFIEMSNDLKEQGNKNFQKREYETAILTYEKAVNLLPKNHIDVAYLRSNVATCYMQMNPADYHRAIKECNLALEVSPKYSKALLKRARCFEALDRLDWALKDVSMVLSLEPNNFTALEISERVRKGLDKLGIFDDKLMVPVPEPVVTPAKSRSRKKKSHKALENIEVKEDKSDDSNKSQKALDKAVVNEKLDGSNKSQKPLDKTIVKGKKLDDSNNNSNENNNENEVKLDDNNNNHNENKNEIEEPKKVVKLILGEDIRWAQVPLNCDILRLREIVQNRFPGTEALLIKYKDKEGDLVTITTAEELRWAEACADPQSSLRLYVVEVNPEKDPLLLEKTRKDIDSQISDKSQCGALENGNVKGSEGIGGGTYIDEWIIEFAQHFRNHMGFDSDEYMDIHELGMKLYSEAMEDIVTSEEAQEIFETAEHKFQEMAALAMFNWGNVHMSRARKRLFLSGDGSTESILSQVKAAYEWAQREYVKAGKRYEEALRIKPDFYEGFLALAQQQFEQARLSWYFAIGSDADLQEWPSSEVLELFNNAEDNMERGTEMWEEMEEHRLRNLSKPNKEKDLLQKLGLTHLFKDISTDEAAEQSSNMRSQINLLWGTMLYERSVVEFKLEIPIWNECLEAAVEKFKLAGSSPTDIAVMLKNHCSNETAQEGLGFKIDEIVQAWNEMYDAKKWQDDVISFRLEPLFRRQVPKLHHVLEHIELHS